MAEVSIAAAAKDFCATHEEGPVALGDEGIFLDRIPKTGPACAGLKFLGGGEEGLAAADAVVSSLFFVVPVLACEGPFGAFLAGDFELLGSELLFPFLIRFGNFFHGCIKSGQFLAGAS